MKIGSETRVVLEMGATFLGLLAFIVSGGLLATWVQGFAGPAAAMGVIVLWVFLGGVGFALWADNHE